MRKVEQVLRLIKSWIWQKDLQTRNRFLRCCVNITRLSYGIVGKLTDGQIALWAMGLAYTTILSLVPLLAVSFSVLKAFGAHYQLQSLLMESLQPLGEQGAIVAANILDFVEKVRVGVLGSVGIALLFYTVITLLHTIERAFNAIWHVPDTRPIGRRFSDYLSVILVGPVLIFAALGITATVRASTTVQGLVAIEPLGSLILALGRLAPYLLVCGAFTFLYVFVTNTQVRLGAAMAGGVFAGVLWYATGNLFTVFVASSSSYSGVYSGFAGAALFIIWLKVGWIVILLGAQLSYYWQYPHLLRPKEVLTVSTRESERLALEIMVLIGGAHYCKQALWNLETLQDHYRGLPPAILGAIVQSLLKHGLIVASNDSPACYLPAYDIAAIDLVTVMSALAGDDGAVCPLPAVEGVRQDIEAAVADSLRGRTVKDLVVASMPAAWRQD